jgi:aminoglycoside 6'-N-acetyltransferase
MLGRRHGGRLAHRVTASGEARRQPALTVCPVIRGHRVRLRPTGEGDLELLLQWFRDPEVYRWWGGRPRTRAEVQEKYLGRRRPRVESYVVEADGEPVGYIQSHTGFAPYHPPGEGGIDMFVAPHVRRRGVGVDAARTLAQHLLRECGWRRVTVDPAKDNPRALAFWRAAGFRHVGDRDDVDGPAELLELTAADVSRPEATGDREGVSVQDVNPPESPRIVAAEIVGDHRTGAECLLARDEDGRELAFAFEVSSDAPGVSLVDPARLRDVAAAPEDDARRFDAVVEPRADEWLPSLVAHPVAAEWLQRIERGHPDAHRRWFEQTQHESGGEQGSG